jgi:hypothetical protein
MYFSVHFTNQLTDFWDILYVYDNFVQWAPFLSSAGIDPVCGL